MKHGYLIAVMLLLGVGMFANPFLSESWEVMSDDASAVVTAFNGLQGTITGAIVGILPMLMGVFVVFLVIRFIPKLIKRFAR